MNSIISSNIKPAKNNSQTRLRLIWLVLLGILVFCELFFETAEKGVGELLELISTTVFLLWIFFTIWVLVKFLINSCKKLRQSIKFPPDLRTLGHICIAFIISILLVVCFFLAIIGACLFYEYFSPSMISNVSLPSISKNTIVPPEQSQLGAFEFIRNHLAERWEETKLEQLKSIYYDYQNKLGEVEVGGFWMEVYNPYSAKLVSLWHSNHFYPYQLKQKEPTYLTTTFIHNENGYTYNGFILRFDVPNELGVKKNFVRQTLQQAYEEMMTATAHKLTQLELNEVLLTRMEADFNKKSSEEMVNNYFLYLSKAREVYQVDPDFIGSYSSKLFNSVWATQNNEFDNYLTYRGWLDHEARLLKGELSVFEKVCDEEERNLSSFLPPSSEKMTVPTKGIVCYYGLLVDIDGSRENADIFIERIVLNKYDGGMKVEFIQFIEAEDFYGFEEGAFEKLKGTLLDGFSNPTNVGSDDVVS